MNRILILVTALALVSSYSLAQEGYGQGGYTKHGDMRAIDYDPDGDGQVTLPDNGVRTNDTRALDWSGSTGITIPDGVESNEPVTVLQWQQSLSGNIDVYLSTNKTLAYTNDFTPTNYTYTACANGIACGPQTVLSALAGGGGDYVFAWIATNATWTTVPGHTVGGALYIAENIAPRSMTAKMEIYRYEPSTSNVFEWGDGGAVFTVPASATPQYVSVNVGVSEIATNVPFMLMARIKRVGGTMNSGDAFLVGSGTNYPTHFQFSVSSDVLLEPYVTKATDQDITGTKTFFEPIYFKNADGSITNGGIKMVGTNFVFFRTGSDTNVFLPIP